MMFSAVISLAGKVCCNCVSRCNFHIFSDLRCSCIKRSWNIPDQVVAAAASVTTHHRRDIVEQLLVNDRRVLTLERLRLMLDPTNVGLVGQHRMQRRLIKRFTASRLSRFRLPRLQAPSTTVKSSTTGVIDSISRYNPKIRRTFAASSALTTNFGLGPDRSTSYPSTGYRPPISRVVAEPQSCRESVRQ